MAASEKLDRCPGTERPEVWIRNVLGAVARAYVIAATEGLEVLSELLVRPRPVAFATYPTARMAVEALRAQTGCITSTSGRGRGLNAPSHS